MKLSPWRKCSIALLSVSLLHMGAMSAATAAIVDTSALVTTDREADLGAIRARLARADVRAQMEQMGVDATAVEQRSNSRYSWLSSCEAVTNMPAWRLAKIS